MPARQLMLPLALPSASKPPRAKAAQLETGPLDLILLGAARVRRPSVVWWWGMRTDPRGFGAYCYLCDRLVCSWSRRWPITQRARRAVHAHRTRHAELLRIDRSIGLAVGGPIPEEGDTYVGDTEPTRGG